jgi:3-oxoacyl-[acyl-carrier protein] reductase
VTASSGGFAIVTGGAGGIGSAICRLLARRSMIVCAIDIDGSALDALAAHDDTGRIHTLVCDIADERQVCETVQQITQRWGGADLLVNNAGVLCDGALVSVLPGGLSKLSTDKWRSVMNVNLDGTFYVTREVVALMIQNRKRGVVINMSSISRRGNAGQSSYAASKAAVSALVTTWARELAWFGIRVAGIAPGLIETPMIKSIPPCAMRANQKRILVNRLGMPEEVASAVSFILDNAYVNGRLLEIDGGLEF